MGLRSGWRGRCLGSEVACGRRTGSTYAMLRYVRAAVLALLLITLVALAGCGSSGGGGRGELLVSAATSLKSAFTSYGERFDAAEAQFSFAGSDELAAQIRSGAKPDVFAAANTKLPEQLFKQGLVERPQVFATNRLVLAVPADGAKVRSLDDLAKKGVTIAVGAEGVPVGAYTRKVLDRLGAAARKAILANVRSEEPDVGGISAKLGQNAVDAGFLYVTDVLAANNRLTAIELPDRLQPQVSYGIAIVKGAPHRDTARRFIAGLLEGQGAGALKRAGFGVAGAAPSETF
jgi:molybdate transport system substrate-binding protein